MVLYLRTPWHADLPAVLLLGSGTLAVSARAPATGDAELAKSLLRNVCAYVGMTLLLLGVARHRLAAQACCSG